MTSEQVAAYKASKQPKPKTHKQVAIDQFRAAVWENVCKVTGKKGAAYAVLVEGTRVAFVGREEGKRGPVVPNANSTCPAERLAARLQAEGISYKIIPTGALLRLREILKKLREEDSSMADFVKNFKKMDGAGDATTALGDKLAEALMAKASEESESATEETSEETGSKRKRKK